ncbi:LOW QUALITY PROTEIN: uncharacterized protein [Labrus bergylta]|uniref:LOW QUALITY PROTEIN: uncharacterized protein n=1 Tax=Labrus bergylta TaxID=56723 RepID=UPI0033134CD7
MAQKGVQLGQESLSCSICLDLLKDPVTVPCGHSYCMRCIKRHWDEEDNKRIYSCPQCRQDFTPRPVLGKNTVLADLVEEKKKTGLQAAPADHCYAGPEDVACDVCTRRKRKALMSCLQCLASYCEKHLQPHYEVPPLKKHKLVEPSKKLQENVCSRHDEVMKMFCRTDQQSICYLCSVDEHKGHDTVSAAVERSERQRELEVSRQNIQQRIQDREKDVKLLQQEVEAINGSADKTVGNSEKIFTELIRLMEKRRSDVKQQVRSQQQTEVSRVRELQEKLEQEITELKRKDAELEKLSHTEDHNQFLHDYPSLSPLSESTHSSSIKIRPLRFFEDVTAAVSEVRDKLQDVLREKWTNISQTVTEVDVLLSEPEPEPKTRAEFLKYSCDITLDPNTAHTFLLLSDENRKATAMLEQQSYCSHPDRFTGRCQVLSKESLMGRCYWEVERRGYVYVAVTYKNISRAGSSYECGFGRNDKSWMLDCYHNGYNFCYNNVSTPVSGPRSSRVGVYLDHRAGSLSFYSVSETMTLLHRVQTTFTQPLHAGLRLDYYGDSAELCKLFFEYIFLYQSLVMFQIDQKTKDCSKIALTEAWDPFDIPANSTFEDQYIIGGPGDNVEVQEWSDRKPARQHETWVGVYTLKDCYPVQETYVRNSSVTTSTRFFNLQLGISDHDVFTPPSTSSNQCEHEKNASLSVVSPALHALSRNVLCCKQVSLSHRSSSWNEAELVNLSLFFLLSNTASSTLTLYFLVSSPLDLQVEDGCYQQELTFTEQTHAVQIRGGASLISQEEKLRQSLLQRGEMAQKGVQLGQETLSCSICLDLLKDPVTVPCGHSYCMNCIKSHWDKEDEKTIYSCPQCRQDFTPRPVLRKNTMLADLVEEKKKTGLQAAPADHCYAGPDDVACDVCTGRKLKARKSCLQCPASYCEKHLQPHFEAPPLKKHKLVEPSKKLQENVCSRHDEVMKMFCRTDQQSICYLCSVDEHKGHDTVSAAAERSERQRELEVSRQNIRQRIQDREKDVKLLQQEVEAINGSADKTVGNSEKIFTELIRLMEKRRSDVKQQVRSQQQTEVSRVRELQEKLEQEITELKRRDAELEKLSHTEDHNQFLHDYPSLSPLSESTPSSSIKIRPLRFFEDVTAAVSEVRDKLQDVLREKWTNISQTVTEVDVLLSEPEPEPKTRAEFLKYSCDITLDPNTAYTLLLLSKRNRKVTVMREHQSYSSHPDRFTGWRQVLSKESLMGRCYWEVEWRGDVCVAVTYKNISRAGRSDECWFGGNDKSWRLDCDNNSYYFYYNNVSTPVSGPWSSRVGVYLDHSAGILSFYSISKTMTLLHRVQTTFTQPLHAGLRLDYYGDSAKLCKLK